MRTIAEIRATGAAWITESELEWLCEQFDAAWKALKAVEAVPFGPDPGRNLLVAQDIVRAVLYPALIPELAGDAAPEQPRRGREKRSDAPASPAPSPASKPDVSERDAETATESVNSQVASGDAGSFSRSETSDPASEPERK